MPLDSRSTVRTPCSLDALDTPALLVDLDVLEGNIQTMARHFTGLSAGLRPHFKTHKCPQIAKMQLAAGAIGITCAKLGEAQVLAANGIQDILIANQVVGALKTERLARLAACVDLKVAVDDPANVDQLSQAASRAQSTIGVLVELDIGMNRCGVKDREDVLALAQKVVGAPGLAFRGLMGYEGHVVLEADPQKRQNGCLAALAKLTDAADYLRSHGLRVDIVSGGGTGTYLSTSQYPGITEVQAGSYVVMDAKYATLGLPFRRALYLLVSVVSGRRDGGCVTDAGLKALASEFGMPCIQDRPDLSVAGLSEEHGLIAASGPKPHVGERLRVVPSHCCTTINLHDTLYGFRNHTVETVWPIEGRGRTD